MFEETLRTRQKGSRGTGAYKVIWNRTDWFHEPFTKETNQYLQELVNLRKKCSEGKGKTQEDHEDWLGRSGIVESIKKLISQSEPSLLGGFSFDPDTVVVN